MSFLEKSLDLGICVKTHSGTTWDDSFQSKLDCFSLWQGSLVKDSKNCLLIRS